jgi:hypothetical protein
MKANCPSEPAAIKKPVRLFCLAFYRTLLLLPITGVVDIFRLNVKLSGQRFYERPYPFYLKVCWADGFVIGYNTDTDSLTASEPSSLWHNRPLSLPLFGWLYLAITGTEAIADNKVTVDVFWTSQAAERGQLFDVSGLGSTIVDFDTVPTIRGLGSLGRNSFFDRVKMIITGEAKWASRGRIVAQGH